METNIINFIEKIDVTNFALVIPSVAVGNVGQLTIDMLITSYHFKKYATVWHPAIIPTAGGDPFFEDPVAVSTACELFVHEDLQLVVMQIRSGLESNLALSFIQNLKTALTPFHFKQVIILSSAFAYELHNVTSSHFRYVSDDNVTRFQDLNVPRLEKDADGEYTIYGGGYATSLYNSLRDSYSCTILFKYTSEGDNRPDAFEMLKILCNYLQFSPTTTTIVYPNSWKYAFGNPPPLGIY
ncbi:hypothetical protein PPYR_15158 [Photinus pyralis]|uniref:Proteasome assembly chaperone 2 n=1 Tax=Photinus pyralis TaxID=7054 RepID=A0A1Y1NFM6_PHOPY|nr:hypothetical protein PPYR_15158 [Photinus pyralis]